MNGLTLPEMRCNHVHFDSFCANEANSGLLVAIDATKPGTEITFPEMSIGQRSLLGGVNRG